MRHLLASDTSNTDLFTTQGFDDPVVQRRSSRSLNQTLETEGYFELEGGHRRLSAHSKVDWATGELLFFDYGDEPPT